MRRCASHPSRPDRPLPKRRHLSECVREIGQNENFVVDPWTRFGKSRWEFSNFARPSFAKRSRIVEPEHRIILGQNTRSGGINPSRTALIFIKHMVCSCSSQFFCPPMAPGGANQSPSPAGNNPRLAMGLALNVSGQHRSVERPGCFAPRARGSALAPYRPCQPVDPCRSRKREGPETSFDSAVGLNHRSDSLPREFFFLPSFFSRFVRQKTASIRMAVATQFPPRPFRPAVVNISHPECRQLSMAPSHDQ